MKLTTVIKSKKGARFLSVILVSLLWVMLVYGCAGKSTDSINGQSSNDGYAKLHALRLHEDSLLTRYKVLDRKKGIYRIPISRAMEIIAAENGSKKGRK